MSSHRPARRARRGLLSSTRVRAVLSLGVALGVGATGTLAAWTDDVVISGSSFTAGVLDIQASNGTTPGTFTDATSTTTLTMAAMVPGNSSAEVLTIKNNNTAPLKYTLAGGLTGADAAQYNTTGALNLTIRSAGTRVGTGNSATCSGGTQIYSGALTNVAGTSILTRRPTAALVQNATEALCFQVTFDANASTGLQGKTATATFTAQGTTDVS